MLETCPTTGRIIHLPLGPGIPQATSATLLETNQLQLIRLVVPAGLEIPPHCASTEVIVHVIEGRVRLSHDGHEAEMQPGDMLFLCPQELHSLRGIEDATVLVTRLKPHAELPETLASPSRRVRP
jgi:quercetin dioxygenase-like cupin family protein